MNLFLVKLPNGSFGKGRSGSTDDVTKARVFSGRNGAANSDAVKILGGEIVPLLSEVPTHLLEAELDSRV